MESTKYPAKSLIDGLFLGSLWMAFGIYSLVTRHNSERSGLLLVASWTVILSAFLYLACFIFEIFRQRRSIKD